MDTTGFTDAPDDQSDSRRVIGIGMDFEAFLRSDVGRYLQRCAERDIANFREEFEQLDFQLDKDATGKAIQLQREIGLRRIWKEWLKEAIDEGHAAQQRVLETGTF